MAMLVPLSLPNTPFAAAGAIATLPVTAWLSSVAAGATSTVVDCCACGAAFQLPSPDWFASMTHEPVFGPKVTLAPAIEQAFASDAASIVNVTASPDVAVAVAPYMPPVGTKAASVDVNEIVWSPGATLKLCCTCGAGWYVPSPAWLASMTQVPAPMNETVDPAIEHTDVAAASIVNVTVRLEVAVALTSYVGPAFFALAGGVEVKLIVCA